MNTNNINPIDDAYPFTPGPWVVHYGFIRSSDKIVIARAPVKGGPSSQFWAKNAKLIAAAPDLLNAAQLAADALFNANADAREAILALDRAIKKAYGK